MGETANTPDTGTDSGANTSPTIGERAERLALAADAAPAFGGLRAHLTEAADFALAIAERLKFDEQTGTLFAQKLADLAHGVDSQNAKLHAQSLEIQALRAELDKLRTQLGG